MKNDLYKYDKKTGNYVFLPEEWLHRDKYKPENFMHHPLFLGLVMLAAGVLDVISFDNVLSSFLYTNQLLRDCSILGLLIIFEAVPALAALSLKKRAQGYSVSKLSIWVPLLLFGMGVAVNFLLRLTVKDQTFVDLSNISTSVIGSGGATQPGGSPHSFVFALFYSVLPVLCGAGIFIISYTTLNPLMAEKKRLSKRRDRLNGHCDQLEAILKETSGDDQLKQMLADEDARFKAALDMIRHKSKAYADHARKLINEFLDDSDARSFNNDYTLNAESSQTDETNKIDYTRRNS